MSVDLQKFNDANEQEKAILLWKNGEFIVERSYYDYKVSLYAMPGFYVEVHYNQETNTIEKICSIKDHNMLDKYLPFLDVPL